MAAKPWLPDTKILCSALPGRMIIVRMKTERQKDYRFLLGHGSLRARTAQTNWFK
jgi:hypothetical protein